MMFPRCCNNPAVPDGMIMEVFSQMEGLKSQT